jgi:hypothetical protein
VAVAAVLEISAVGSQIAARHVATVKVTAAAPKRVHAIPAVYIGGGPILPQVISGQSTRVSLSAKGASLGPFANVDLSADLTGIYLPRAGRPASTGHATAVVPRLEIVDLIARGGLAQASRGLPFGLTVTGVHPTSGNVEIAMEASNTTLN